MDYSPFNPVVWLTFAGFLVVVYVTVKFYHGKYPNYPYEPEESDEHTFGRKQVFTEQARENQTDQVRREAKNE